MKNIYWLFILLVSLSFGACEADPEYFQEKNSYVAFNGSSSGVTENAEGELKIPVRISTVKPKAVTVDFEIMVDGLDAPAEEGVDYQIINESKSLSFAKGQLSDTIRIMAIDNDVLDGDKKFIIKLKSNNAGISLGLENGIKTQFMVTITDDEHPLALVLGAYEEHDYNLEDGSHDAYSPYDITISPDPSDATRVLISNVWGEQNVIVATVDLENKTMSILPDQVLANHPTYGDIKFVRVDTSIGEYDRIGAIVCQIDDNGNITTEAWAALVEAGYFGLYGKSEFIKK